MRVHVRGNNLDFDVNHLKLIHGFERNHNVCDNKTAAAGKYQLARRMSL